MLSQLSYAPIQCGFLIHRVAVALATCYSIPRPLSFVNTFFHFFQKIFLRPFYPFRQRAAIYHRSLFRVAGVKL